MSFNNKEGSLFGVIPRTTKETFLVFLPDGKRGVRTNSEDRI